MSDIIKATVECEVNIKYARTALRCAGFSVDDKTAEEICKLAIGQNAIYAVDTKNILLKENDDE